MANSADPDQWASSEATDLDLHCLLRQGMSCSAREELILKIAITTAAEHMLIFFFFFFYFQRK